MLTLIQKNNLLEAAKQARTCEQTTGVPCELIVGQWAQESGWGTKTVGNNCFGIKEYEGCWGRQMIGTHEYFTPEQVEIWLKAKAGRTAHVPTGGVLTAKGQYRYSVLDWFASFETLADCFSKRASIIMKHVNPQVSIQLQQAKATPDIIRILTSGYATDPNYAQEIIDISEMPDVVAAILAARTPSDPQGS